MNREHASALVTSAIRTIAPDAEIDSIAADQTMQEGLGMDSIDFLDFVARLEAGAGIGIPERDYVELITFDGCVSYLVCRT